jgi:hypothetical protein
MSNHTKQIQTAQMARRGTEHKEEKRDKVVRIRSGLFEEMSNSKLGRKWNVDFDDICSEVWDFWKEHHKWT